jgi:fumarate reductase subunit C
MAEAENTPRGWKVSRRPYVRPVETTTWYLRHPRYRNYMLREATCILVAVYFLLVLKGLMALASNQSEAWDRFLAGQQHPAWATFHAVALVFFMLYQTMPWFRLAPKAMPIRLGQNELPASMIVAAHYLVWVLVSAAVFWLSGVFR